MTCHCSIANGEAAVHCPIRDRMMTPHLLKKCKKGQLPVIDGSIPCIHRGQELRREECDTCKGKVLKKVYECSQYGECVLGPKPYKQIQNCGRKCPSYTQDLKAERALPAVVPNRIPEWTFITNQMHAQHATELIRYVPHNCTGIVGISRSGLPAATIIATTLNLPLWELSGRYGLRQLGSGSRTSGLTRKKGPFFVIDDSAYSGLAARNARKALHREDAILAVVYCRPEVKGVVDCYARLLSSPHFFEWNLFNNGIVHGNASDPRLRGGIGFDMDGVICEECPVNDQNDAAYRQWINTAAPRSIPRLIDIPLLATARIPSYEKETKAWLKRWNIRPRKLALYPAAVNRRSYQQVANHKAKAAKEAGVSVFVESSEVQARLIAKQAQIPVICTDTGEVYR